MGDAPWPLPILPPVSWLPSSSTMPRSLSTCLCFSRYYGDATMAPDLKMDSKHTDAIASETPILSITKNYVTRTERTNRDRALGEPVYTVYIIKEKDLTGLMGLQG